MKQEHKYAKVLRWIADGEQVQFNKISDLWVEIPVECVLMTICDGTNIDRFRIKPRTVRVNGVEVPAPESTEPKKGQLYYIPTPDTDEMCSERRDHSGYITAHLMERGLVYLNKEDAIARAKAMLITQEC